MTWLKPRFISAGAVLFGVDLVCVAAVWPVIVLMAMPPAAAWMPGWLAEQGLLFPVLNAAAFYAMGLYRREAIADTKRACGRIPIVVGMGSTAAAGLSALPGLSMPNGGLWAGALAGFTLAAWLARLIFSGMQRRRLLHRRVLVLGAGRCAFDLLIMLTREGTNLHYDIAFQPLPDGEAVDPRLAAFPGVNVLPRQSGPLLDVARAVGADQIVVAVTDRRGMGMRALLECKIAGFPVLPYLSFIEREIRRIDLKRIELGWLVFSSGFTVSALDRACKRLFDIGISLIVLILTGPLILGGILAIRWEGRGPIFYRQDRITLQGRVFPILKLRTMRPDAEANGAVWAAARDGRITRVGRFLRRTRIDELPQLINILRGDMSFVGPRPERPMFVRDLACQIPLYDERHMVKTGLTGWAQINYPYGASVNDARSKLSYDLYYVKHSSLLFDLAILSQTLREVLWPSGVR